MNTLADALAASKGVVFDLYHTLTARESEWSVGPMTYQMLGVTRQQWEQQLFESSRFRLAGEERDPHRIITRMALAIDPQMDARVIERAVQNRINRFGNALTNIPPHNVRLLSALRERGFKLGLVSNADAMETQGWEQSPLAGFFHSTVFSCEVGWVKPEPEIFLHSLRELGLQAHDCLFVGDGGSNELAAARALGFRTVMVAGVIRELWADKIASRARDADFLIEDPIELIETVLR
jgi:putative hydrolase of the HAD superfamily